MPENHWRVTDENYLQAPAAAVLAFHGVYPQGHQGGIEIIHHGERVATCGEVRPHPRWWRPEEHSRLEDRRADPERCAVDLRLTQPALDLPYEITLRGDGNAVILTVQPGGTPDPDAEAGFCLELYPPAYFGKTFHVDGRRGVFPRDPLPASAKGPDWHPRALPLASGRRVIIAPEDPERRMVVEGMGCEIALLDPRKGDEEMWFCLCTGLDPGAADHPIEWRITPHQIEGWRRKPVVCLSQVGYHPDQRKRAVIEMDRREDELGQAALFRADEEGGWVPVLQGPVENWGCFLAYRYGTFDFTRVRRAGLYQLRYRDCCEGPFRIGKDVYNEGVWQPTLTSYLPVQMCHTAVWDGLRLWHNACHLDDALQAPVSHEHFDHYRQGDSTDTDCEPFEHVLYLDRGGWHDAGDTDLAAGSQAATAYPLALAYEEFGPDLDWTTVRADERLVLMFQPDGEPDILQQIAWGAECMLGGYRAAGHSFCGIVAGDERPYYQRGEVATMTDNLIYDPSLAKDQRTGTHSGRRDDRWAFTNRDTALEYRVTAALAAASRALAGHDDELARECLQTAERAWRFERENPPARHRSGYVPRTTAAQEVVATAELFLTTGQDEYAGRLDALLPVIEEHPGQVGWAAARALPQMEDNEFRDGVREALAGYAQDIKHELESNPFGVLWEPRIWGIAWQALLFARRHYYLVRAFPRLFDREDVLAVLNYVLGCHPGGNLSLVAAVGARFVTQMFGINRSSRSYVPGGVVSGPNLVRPHFVEYKKDTSFLWQQSENVIGGAGNYIFCVLAAEGLLRGQ